MIVPIKFFQSNAFVGNTYPEMAIAYKPLDQVHHSTDLARLKVTYSQGGGSWALRRT